MFVQVRMERTIKEKFDQLADEDARSTTYVMNEALAEYLERHSNYEKH